jgi:hypothetical protein
VLGSLITLGSLLLRRKPKLARGPAKSDAVTDKSEVGQPTADSTDEPSSSLHTLELPFGPYLAAAALFYLFAEPWMTIRFRLLGG